MEVFPMGDYPSTKEEREFTFATRRYTSKKK
jgi:hypothetical protein